MFVIEGIREKVGETKVTLNGKPLSLHLDLVNHSPTGFEWGYGGSGPSQLAFCIVYEFCKRVLKYPSRKEKHLDVNFIIASRVSQYFKWQFLANLKSDTFIFKQEDIETFIKASINEYVNSPS